MSDGAKRVTEGVDPKVPIQAVVTLIVFFAAGLGLDLDDETSAALGVILGAIAAALGPAARTRVESVTGRDRDV